METYAYGFPKLGKEREFKRAVEGLWKKEFSEEAFWEKLTTIQTSMNREYTSAGIDRFSRGEISLYDPMLDTAILCGLFNPKNLEEYYRLCRGESALAMTKWFNTNYHYLVTDFSAINDRGFWLNSEHFSLKFKKCEHPNFIGPFTFLKLSKGIETGSFGKKLLALAGIYKELLKATRDIRLEEPAFVLDISDEEISLIKEVYAMLAVPECRITLITYYDSVDWIKDMISLPVAAIGLDLIRGSDNYEYIIKEGFPDDKKLIAGLIDGRNVWRTDARATEEKLKVLSKKVKNLALSNAAPLYHLPYSVMIEEKLSPQLKSRLSFAKEKLHEIKEIASGDVPDENRVGAGTWEYGKNSAVQERVKKLTPSDFIKKINFEERRKIQDKLLDLPLFPSTTIGSFPQHAEVRQKRKDYINGCITEKDYREFINNEIEKVIRFQENLGLDVLVHGEFERTDMVEFFAQKLEGIVTTQNGWILSYGTRTYRPPIIFGDVSRSKPMTVDEIAYAQSKTKKPVKGMLTGPVTIIAWSFCREDIPVSEIAYQISLCLRDEIRDLEKVGIRIVQVDEPAFKERAPLKKKNWPEYFDWAIKSFNLATNTEPETQIHTHMCYSEFGEIIGYINQMDFDVISIEASRSKGDIIKAFEKSDFKRQIGLGVWDVHSPAVPDTEKMMRIINIVLESIPAENLWINPDCGLKTRDWPETETALKNMMQVVSILRKTYRR